MSTTDSLPSSASYADGFTIQLDIFERMVCKLSADLLHHVIVQLHFTGVREHVFRYPSILSLWKDEDIAKGTMMKTTMVPLEDLVEKTAFEKVKRNSIYNFYYHHIYTFSTVSDN